MDAPQLLNQAQTQGYLATGERPQCSNCWVCKPKAYGRMAGGTPIDGCKHGKFPVALDGWCPLWFPTDGWIRAHPRVAAKLGMNLVMDSTVSTMRTE
jgi:hypothetical protein